jgi:hypothetical protein
MNFGNSRVDSLRELVGVSTTSTVGSGLQSFTLDAVPMTPATKEEQIRSYYSTLYESWGPQHWWPARTRLEVIVGAYLTQNTSWTNVEIALRRLRGAGLLSLAAIRGVPLGNSKR